MEQLELLKRFTHNVKSKSVKIFNINSVEGKLGIHLCLRMLMQSLQ
jgi:hypothetical protein